MRKEIFNSFVLFTCLAFPQIHGDIVKKNPPQNAQITSYTCGESAYPMRIAMRHIEGKGVGYNLGYSTLEGFFAFNNPMRGEWVPFLDLRGHIFDNGKPAVNGGLGLRYLSSSRVWGINAYYDYRNTVHQHYNQVSAGLESLGQIWDFRVNGYLPVGEKISPFFKTTFHDFQNHFMILSRRREIALAGANAEVGAHVNNIKDVPLYFVGGAYYLNGQGKQTWGAEFRLAIDFLDHIRMEGNVSYDRLFKVIGQGQLSLMFPFGGRKEIRQKEKTRCSQALALSERAVQPVDRNEIIPVDKKRKKTPAINPATGQPFFFLFVDNTSSSAGTFSSPYSTLLAAQLGSSPNDIIYVFPGDGTTNGMDAGITLKDNQKFLGAGMPHTLMTTQGAITIPAFADSMPKMTNFDGNALSLANSNEVAGFNIFNIGGQLDVTGINNFSFHNNRVDVLEFFVGLNIDACGGNITVADNVFTATDAEICVRVRSTASGANYLFRSNQFYSEGACTAIELGDGDSTLAIGNFNTFVIANNQFVNMGSFDKKAVGGFGFDGTGHFSMDHNTFTHCGSAGGPPATVFIQIQAGGNLSASFTNNLWQDTTTLGEPNLDVRNVDPTSTVCVTLINNVGDSAPNAYREDNAAGGTFTADVSGNTGTVQEIGAITPGVCP